MSSHKACENLQICPKVPMLHNKRAKSSNIFKKGLDERFKRQVHHTVAADVDNRSLHLAYNSMMLTLRGKRPLPELQSYNLYFRLVYQSFYHTRHIIYVIDVSVDAE